MALSPRVIGWKQFFEDLDVHEAFPVTHLPVSFCFIYFLIDFVLNFFYVNVKDVLIELFKVRDPVALDFSGIDQLSDEVFFVFKTSLQVRLYLSVITQ